LNEISFHRFPQVVDLGVIVHRPLQYWL